MALKAHDIPRERVPQIDISQNVAEFDTLAGIKTSLRMVDQCNESIKAMQEARNTLAKRRTKWEQWAKIGKYDPSAMSNAISSMELEDRKLMDVMSQEDRKKAHHLLIINTLEQKLRDEKAQKTA
jgi:hypothetical protein